MLGDSSSVLAATTTPSRGGGAGGSGPDQAAASHPSHHHHHHLEVGHVVGPNNNSADEDRARGGGADEGDRSFGGNRWPREETLALLRIRSDMDVAFRDASVKGPLWDEVSRKLAELGYNRSSKKCKEKFENVYKYHKRTKEGRSGKQEGKAYRFFDQLEAFESHPPPSFPPPPPKPQPATIPTLPMPVVNPPAPPPPAPAPAPASHPPPPPLTSQSVGASHIISPTVTSIPDQGIVSTGINLTVPPFAVNPTVIQEKNPINVSSSVPSFSGDLLSNSTSSSSTSSDMEIQGRRRKRKWKDFFERLMKEVIHRQEDMQNKFLEAIEKREHERMVREESWRMQEMSRINREREILAQERSMASAKDAAVMAFLQKLSDQQNPPPQQQQVPNQQPPQQQIPPPKPVQASAPVPASAPPPPPQPQQASMTPQPIQASAPAQAMQPQAMQLVPTPVQQQEGRIVEFKGDNNGDQALVVMSGSGASSSRWPKVEVEALIHLRTTLDSKYQENGPKGPLWEEISAGMRKLGYNRNAKRCKEKWENINKYFKKVKESNKKRPEDSKTCPYFHQLDALYREKNSNVVQFKPENSVPLMVRPEQQWPPPPAPPPPPPQPSQHDSVMDDLESDQDHDNDDDEDDDEAGGYEIVPNRQTSISSAG
ncbi:trihelix transcription factor DF1-like [Euphorbia lathyris]|uniref:trihelix transcription factor DF1-like n=1 Tax=Euphorbia lathyris TaxID=212925 RepID=UPI0033143383